MAVHVDDLIEADTRAACEEFIMAVLQDDLILAGTSAACAHM